VKLRADGGGERLDETASLDGRMKGKPARYAFAGAGRIIHHILWHHPRWMSIQVLADEWGRWYFLDADGSRLTGEVVQVGMRARLRGSC